MAVFALGWIALWFSGTPEERAKQWHAPIQSLVNGVCAREINHQGPGEDASDTFDSFRHDYDVETATPIIVN